MRVPIEWSGEVAVAYVTLAGVYNVECLACHWQGPQDEPHHGLARDVALSHNLRWHPQYEDWLLYRDRQIEAR